MTMQVGTTINIYRPFRGECTGTITKVSDSSVWIDEQRYSLKTGKEINANKFPYQRNSIEVSNA